MAIEITVQNDTENPFLERRDVTFTVTSDGATPKADDVRAALASKLKVPEKNISVEHIYQKMGLHVSDCIAKVYKKSVVAEKEGEVKEGDAPAADVPSEEKKDDVKADAASEETQPEKKEGEKAEEDKKE